MRLLNTRSLQLTEFNDDSIPPYAILSHTWGADEVSFQDVQTPPESPARQKEGFSKVESCCQQAAGHGLQWAWVDTCCIDKTSSAELSEAINSMFRWYANAQICFAYLEDMPDYDKSEGLLWREAFKSSRWFTRGWTLQELLAPRSVMFHNSAWKEIGTKSYLCDLITDITGIDEEIIMGGNLASLSIAKRMSWASTRSTTRTEDLAYCLMGIFNVNMPLIYGEGNNAFLRLQEEILKNSDDQSLFAWKARGDFPSDMDSQSQTYTRGALALSPAEFEACRNIVPFEMPESLRGSHSITNKGIKMKLPLQSSTQNGHISTAVLACREEGDFRNVLAISLKPGSLKGSQYYRVNCTMLQKVPLTDVSPREMRKTYITKAIVQGDPYVFRDSFLIRTFGSAHHSYRLSNVFPSKTWSPEYCTVRTMRHGPINRAGLLFESNNKTKEPRLIVVLGFNAPGQDARAWYHIFKGYSNPFEEVVLSTFVLQDEKASKQTQQELGPTTVKVEFTTEIMSGAQIIVANIMFERGMSIGAPQLGSSVAAAAAVPFLTAIAVGGGAS